MMQKLSYVDWSEFKQEKYPRSMRLRLMNTVDILTMHNSTCNA